MKLLPLRAANPIDWPLDSFSGLSGHVIRLDHP